MDKQLFVYEEDNQLYWHNHVLMSQEGNKPVDVEQLEKMSWEPPAAGRLSTKAEDLAAVGAKHGLKLRFIERREQSESVPRKWAHLPFVRGATGNY